MRLFAAVFLLGYGLAIPIGMRLPRVVAEQNRLALAGHQLGVLIALVGWALRESVALAVFHGLWLVVARLWFDAAGRRQAAAGSGPPRSGGGAGRGPGGGLGR